MNDMSNARAEIDSIDDSIAGLFMRRMELMGDIVAAKRAKGASVTDPARERAILTRVAEKCGPDLENGARLLFSTIFGISRARQRLIAGGKGAVVEAIEKACAESKTFPTRAVVACPGTEGSYAQQSVSRMFSLPTILYFTSFGKVFEAVENGLCPYGVLPIENSAAGSVAAVYDLMQKHRFHIVKSLRLKVDHVLLAPKGVSLVDVREVRSHPHALAQCGGFLSAHPQMRAVPGGNTAAEAKALAESGRRDAAAIASRACAELYGLDVVAEGIADAAFNYTRFICISKNLEIYPDANKFSIMMSLPHRPGALNSVIAKFASINVNLTKLESRPVPGMDFEFRFIFDFEASATDPAVLALVSELSSDPEIEHFTFLGAYGEK